MGLRPAKSHEKLGSWQRWSDEVGRSRPAVKPSAPRGFAEASRLVRERSSRPRPGFPLLERTAPRVPPVLPSPRGVPLFCCSAFIELDRLLLALEDSALRPVGLLSTKKRSSVLRRRQQNGLTLGDHHGVLVVRREASIGRADGPPVALQFPLAAPGGDDGLDGDDQSFVQSGAATRVVEIGNVGWFMDGLTHPVSAQLAHYLKAAAAGLLLHGAADVIYPVARSGRFRRQSKRALGRAHQPAGCLAHLPHGNRERGVRVKHVLLRHQVQFYQVPRPDRTAAWDTVNRFLRSEERRVGKEG